MGVSGMMCKTTWVYLDNSPPGQFPTEQVFVLLSCFTVGSGPGVELS